MVRLDYAGGVLEELTMRFPVPNDYVLFFRNGRYVNALVRIVWPGNGPRSYPEVTLTCVREASSGMRALDNVDRRVAHRSRADQEPAFWCWPEEAAAKERQSKVPGGRNVDAPCS